MQGQRGIIDSLPETFDFDHGASSSNTGVDQHIWNNVRNPVETELPDYMLSPNETNITYGNAVGHDGLNLGGWSLGESSSSENTRHQAAHDEAKVEHGWPSSLSIRAGSSPRLEERRYEQTDILSLENTNISLSSNQVATGSLVMQSSSSDGSHQTVDVNAGYEINSGNAVQVMGTRVCSHPYKSGESEVVQVASASDSSNLFGTNSGSAGFLVEGNDSRSGYSLDGQRLSCKRKAFEGASGWFSLGGSSSCFRRAENSLLNSVPACQNAGRSLNISIPSENPPVVHHQEQLNPRLGIDVIGVASDSFPAQSVVGNAERSRRNSHMRMNPIHQQDSMPPNILSTGSVLRRSHVRQPHQSSRSRVLPFNNSLDSRSTAAAANRGPQNQSHLTRVRGSSRNVHPYQALNSGVGSLLSFPVISGDRGVTLREEPNSRNMRRSIPEHPMFAHATEMRNLAHDPSNWSLGNGNISIPGNVTSTSRIGSSSSVHSSPVPSWVPQHNPPAQYPRRLSEFVRQSMFLAAGSEAGSQSSTFPPLLSDPSGSSQEVVLPSGDGHQGHHHQYTRSALWMERQGDGVLGLPYSLRGMAAAGEGRSRLVSQIRNVLDLMRRSENLQFEDVFILDRSVFYGMGDLHDRHREMRLDVDNMSYEELLALEERIGNVNTGLNEETILKCLKQKKYFSITTGAPPDVVPCCICQEDYVDGEDLSTLECGHDFHTGCVKQWLMNKNSCPICKTTAMVT